MLLYICACLAFLSVAKSSQVKTLEPSNVKPINDGPKATDAIFADVIKNISRVNHVLQELINNYEQLQKIYKSQENVDSVYTDSEIDEVFKSKNGKKHAKRTKENAVTKKTISKNFAATQMYWSDHEEDNDRSSDDTEDDKKETVKEVTKQNITLEPKILGTTTTRVTTLRPVRFDESSGESSDTSSPEKAKKYKDTAKNTNKSKQLQPAKPILQAEVVFIDTHKKKKVTPTKPKIQVDSVVQFAGVPTKHKTRYSKVSHSKATNAELQAQNVASKTGSNDRDVQKVMYAESFSPQRIWNDIINNKPIQLEAHNEITLRRVDKEKTKKRNNTTFNKRSKVDSKKPAVVIITKSKNKEKEEHLSSEDDLTLKEQLKTNVLRQAYGDACLKLVLRKCHKACKKVSKSACGRVKCKSAAKSAFADASRTGCIKEFNGIDTAVTTPQFPANPMYTHFRGKDGAFVDMTREGFLSAACLPHLQVQKPTILRNATSLDPVQNFNILRDRFERACKRVSSDKCINACNFATKEMCTTITCSKRMEKVFKKTCKKHCKEAYGLYKDNSDSESDSDSDSESESESVTDSDSD